MYSEQVVRRTLSTEYHKPPSRSRGKEIDIQQERNHEISLGILQSDKKANAPQRLRNGNISKDFSQPFSYHLKLAWANAKAAATTSLEKINAQIHALNMQDRWSSAGYELSNRLNAERIALVA